MKEGSQKCPTTAVVDVKVGKKSGRMAIMYHRSVRPGAQLALAGKGGRGEKEVCKLGCTSRTSLFQTPFENPHWRKTIWEPTLEKRQRNATNVKIQSKAKAPSPPPDGQSFLHIARVFLQFDGWWTISSWSTRWCANIDPQQWPLNFHSASVTNTQKQSLHWRSTLTSLASHAIANLVPTGALVDMIC